MRRQAGILLRVLALVGVIWVLGGLPQPADTLLWKAVYDAGHAPLFGLAALSILSLLRIVIPGERGLKLYLFAFLTATALGGITELAQFFGSRDADLGDFIRNAAGAASFLTFRRLLERGTDNRPVVAGSVIRVTAAILAGFLLLAVCIPVAARIADYRGRNDSFPMLCDFESRWERSFVRAVAARVEPADLPQDLGEPPGRKVGRWTLYSRPWPGLALREPYPDWSGYLYVRFEIWSGLDRPVAMTLMAEDRLHHPGSGDRARVRFTVEPGRNDIRIKLEELRNAPPNRILEMDQVALVILYTSRPEEPFTLWIDSIRLE